MKERVSKIIGDMPKEPKQNQDFYEKKIGDAVRDLETTYSFKLDYQTSRLLFNLDRHLYEVRCRIEPIKLSFDFGREVWLLLKEEDRVKNEISRVLKDIELSCKTQIRIEFKHNFE